MKAIDWDPSMSKDPNAPFNQRDDEYYTFEGTVTLADISANDGGVFAQVVRDLFYANANGAILPAPTLRKSVIIHSDPKSFSKMAYPGWFGAILKLVVMYAVDYDLLDDHCSECDIDDSEFVLKWCFKHPDLNAEMFAMTFHIYYSRPITSEDMQDEIDYHGDMEYDEWKDEGRFQERDYD